MTDKREGPPNILEPNLHLNDTRIPPNRQTREAQIRFALLATRLAQVIEDHYQKK